MIARRVFLKAFIGAGLGIAALGFSPTRAVAAPVDKGTGCFSFSRAAIAIAQGECIVCGRHARGGYCKYHRPIAFEDRGHEGGFLVPVSLADDLVRYVNSEESVKWVI